MQGFTHDLVADPPTIKELLLGYRRARWASRSNRGGEPQRRRRTYWSRPGGP